MDLTGIFLLRCFGLVGIQMPVTIPAIVAGIPGSKPPMPAVSHWLIAGGCQDMKIS